MAKTINLTRSQLYSMAAASSFGAGTEMVVSFDSYTDDGSIIGAVLARDNASETHKKYAHENGWIYYHVNRDGVIKPLKEDEL